ncbi:MAG: bacteriochlorophyll 4-vinyl reductase [Burkholderiales bacterium]
MAAPAAPLPAGPHVAVAGTAAARVGPNAITRVADALRAHGGEPVLRDVFAAAGLVHHLAAPPTAMVDEADVTALARAVRERLPPAVAQRVHRDAGTATGDYLLAHRIPRAAQVLLRALPARLAAPLLCRAIGAHAWTFVGSGRFRVERGRRPVLVITGGPLARAGATPGPACDYFAATFERLFRALVHPQATATEVACEAAGAPACRFAIAW